MLAYLFLAPLSTYINSTNESRIRHEPDTIESLGRFRFDHLESPATSSVQADIDAVTKAAARKSDSWFAKLAGVFAPVCSSASRLRRI